MRRLLLPPFEMSPRQCFVAVVDNRGAGPFRYRCCMSLLASLVLHGPICRVLAHQVHRLASVLLSQPARLPWVWTFRHLA